MIQFYKFKTYEGDKGLTVAPTRNARLSDLKHLWSSSHMYPKKQCPRRNRLKIKLDHPGITQICGIEESGGEESGRETGN